MTKQAWHFTDGNKLRDGRELPPVGEWLEHDGKLVMCESGLHASYRAIDALEYAPGSTLHRVEIGGEIVEDDDKIVCQKRRILWSIDADTMLLAFARWCALQVVHLWDAPPVVIEYLTTGDESKRSAAGAAAWAAAWDTAAAGVAAWDAAAAGVAAWVAARAAARAAAWAAAWVAQNEQLERMIEEARNGKTEWIFEVPEVSDGLG